ncbi:MAG: BON domain-containing protein [Deltaproteobacteria bacterium]|nr:BON domain-containing protein [Deltaproteobacteria bacterium]MCB9786307.1 BON domain-containing protein [Deltaproteobacteria bacterium]
MHTHTIDPGPRRTPPRRRHRPGVIAAAVAALLCVGLQSRPAHAGRTVDDSTISQRIQDELLYDPMVSSSVTDVSTANGIVTLTGTVNSLVAKERATRIARTVKGVRSVVNRMEVAPLVSRTDAQLRKDVEEALAADPAADGYQITVTAINGTVTLRGTVDSWQEKQLSRKVAGSVIGVRDVIDQIDIRYASERPDSELEKEVRETLRWDTLIDDALVRVSVQDGRVSLGGVVGSAAEKTRAVDDAWVGGVKAVDDTGLEVARWARDEDLRSKKYIRKPDADVEKAIESALLVDPRVRSSSVDVEVDTGIVHLRGTVATLKAKRAAANDARSTTGVLAVRNNLRVAPGARASDKTVENAVKAALRRDPHVSAYDMTVTVRNGVVTLGGTVSSFLAKEIADQVASGVDGVLLVDNDVRVLREGTPAVYDIYVDDVYPYTLAWYDATPVVRYAMNDDAIREAIEDEMWWSPFVDADDVHVSVVGGVATLTGKVESWAERTAAIENAYEGGAASVYDHMTLELPDS